MITILSAAIVAEKGLGAVIGGYRHPHARENYRRILASAGASYSEIADALNRARDGFIASNGVFYDRLEAYDIALSAGQITDDGGLKLLTSEMLY